MNKKIKLNKIQQAEVIKIASHGANEASFHIRKILRTGRSLFLWTGIEVNLKMAIKRRRRCIGMAKLALKGFVV